METSMKGKGKGKISRHYCLLLSVLFYIVLSSLVVFGSSEAIKIVEDIAEYDLTNTILIIEDKDKGLEIEDILNNRHEDQFIPYNDSGFSGVISESAFWIKVILSNTTDKAQNMFLEISKPHLGNLQFYRYLDGQMINEVQTGRHYSFDNREVKHRNFVFEMNLLPQTEEEIFFRVETESYLQFPVKLYKTQSFLEKEYQSQLVFGTYYGIMLVMFLYNLVLLISLKEKTYLYYILYIFGFSMIQLVWDGLAFQYLWPTMPAWDIKANPFFLICTSIFALQFSRSFLRVKEKSRALDRWITYFMLIMTISAIFTLFIPAAITTKLAVFIVSIALVTCIINIFIVGNYDRTVYLYSTAWAMLFLGVILNLLAAYRILPINFITLYSPRIGSIAEVVLLSLALVDRFNRIKQEKIVEEKQRVLLKTLHDITKTLTSTHDLEELIQYILKNVAELAKFENGLLILKQQDSYTIKDALGYMAKELKGRELTSLEGEKVFWRIVLENKTTTLADLDMRGFGIDKKIGTLIGIPIAYHKELLGLMILYSFETRKTNELESKIIYDFAGQVGISIQNLRLFNEIKRMAATDDLTGAWNRKHFASIAEGALQEAQRNNRSLSIIMIDIDWFKQINDSYGHMAGDKVLVELVVCLRSTLNEGGCIGRYGGEEFLVLLRDIGIHEAYKIAESMRRAVERMKVYLDEASTVGFTISMGLSTLKKDTKDIWELIDKADQALYISKENGRNLVNIS